jgi:hypothetical protein
LVCSNRKSYVIVDIELVVIAARLLASPICFKCSVFPYSKKDLHDIISDNICDKLEALFSNADCAADADKIGTTTAAAINDIVVPLLKAGADMSGIKNDAANRFGAKFAEFATKFKQEELKPWWEAASSTLPDINAHIADIATKDWASCAFSMSLKSVADAQPKAKVSTLMKQLKPIADAGAHAACFNQPLTAITQQYDELIASHAAHGAVHIWVDLFQSLLTSAERGGTFEEEQQAALAGALVEASAKAGACLFISVASLVQNAASPMAADLPLVAVSDGVPLGVDSGSQVDSGAGVVHAEPPVVDAGIACDEPSVVDAGIACDGTPADSASDVHAAAEAADASVENIAQIEPPPKAPRFDPLAMYIYIYIYTQGFETVSDI